MLPSDSFSDVATHSLRCDISSHFDEIVMSHNLMHPAKLSRRNKIITNESVSVCIHVSRKSTLMGKETQAR